MHVQLFQLSCLDTGQQALGNWRIPALKKVPSTYSPSESVQENRANEVREVPGTFHPFSPSVAQLIALRTGAEKV